MKLKFKKIFCSVLSVAIIFTVSSCKNNDADNNTSDTNSVNSQYSETVSENINSSDNSKTEIDSSFNPVMWQVQLDNNQKFYLIGSYHAGDFDILSVPEIYQDAFNSCDFLAVECNTNAITSDYNAMLETSMRYIYSDGTTLKDHISEETYNLLVKYLKDYSDEYSTLSLVLDYMKAEYWAMYVETPLIYKSGLDINKGIDYQLMSLAESKNKKILSIENYIDSLNAFSGYSDIFYELQILTYVANSEGIDSYIDEFKELYNIWKSGSKEIQNIINSDDNDELNLNISNELENKINSNEELLTNDTILYNKKMITDRNKIMADAAIQYIKEGKNVFFVVGAAHMYGDDGVIQSLKNNGYVVTQICGEIV